jgi:ADP-heptose:LPS heptosyltransferase
MSGADERALLCCAGGGIGDSLLASVVARALRGRFRRVDALTLPHHRAALTRVPDLDDVVADEGEPPHVLAARLRERTYAAAVVTWATARVARAIHAAEIPIRVGQARRLYSWRFTHRVRVRSEDGDVTTHWTQILLDYARALGCDTRDTTPRFEPTAADEAAARAVRERHGLEAGGFVVVHPTNAIAPRRGIWPVEGWIALVRALATDWGLPVVVSGTGEDAAIVGAISGAAGAISVAGELEIGAFGAFVRDARCFVGITTGTMHVAAAVGTPTVGIFPFQSDVPDRWAPLGPRTAVVRASYPCRPGDTKERCRDYACIAHLDVERIRSAVRALCAVAAEVRP